MRHLILLFFVVICSKVYSQGLTSATERHTNLYTLKAELEPYFANLLREVGETEFYAEGSEYNAYKRFLDYWEPLVYPHGNFSTYFQAEENYWESGHSTKAPGNIDNWLELGPTTNPSNYNGIGPVEFITINDNNPLEMLAGSLSGGLFYSNDGAESWSNSGSDGWENSGCAHAIFHPTLTNVIYACSNKENSNSGPSIIGTMGHVKRKVGGVWETIGDHNDFGDSYNKYFKLLADPLNSNRLYLATLYGLYFTDNANAPASSVTWIKFTDPLLQGKIYDIEFVPNQTGSLTQKIVVTVYSSTLNQWNVVHTTNHGLTWQTLSGQPALSGANSTLTIEPTKANPDNLYVYIAGTPRMLYKYVWSSSLWSSLGISLTGDNYGGGHCFGVSPIDENKLAINNGTSLKRTITGGTSWLGAAVGHSDVEDVVYHPTDPNVVFIGNHGGCYKSTDNGANFISKSEGLGIAEVQGMSSGYTDPGRIAVGLFHDGNMVTLNSYDPVSWLPEWEQRLIGDGIKPLVDYQNENNVWLLHQYYPLLNSLSFFDDIQTSSYVSLYNATFKSAGWEGNVVQHTTDPSRIFFTFEVSGSGGNQDVARADNYGQSGKTRISNFGIAPHNLTDYSANEIYFAPSNPNILYTYVVDTDVVLPHKLFRTLNANDPSPTWTQLQIPFSKYISDIDVSYDDPNVIYISYNDDYNSVIGNGENMLFRIDYTSTNNYVLGVNGFDLTGNLPGAYAGTYCTSLEKGTNEGIYFATNVGIYFSNATMFDAGLKNWVKIGTNSPHVVPRGLEINYVANKIRVSYEGRGTWEHDLYCPTQDYAVETGVYSADKFVEVLLAITSTATVNSGREVDYRSAYEITLNPGFRANPGSDFNAFIHRCNASGNSFKNSLENSEIASQESESKKVVDDKILVYPNPSPGLVTIQINEFDANNSDAQLTIYNAQGKIVKQIKITGEKTEVDLSDNASGIYLLYFTDGKSTRVTRLSKTN